MKNFLIILTAVFTFSTCTAQNKKAPEITGLDTSIKPGDNFFMYVNKKWYDATPIPATQAGVGAYMFMNFPQRIRLQGILESVSKGQFPAGSVEQKVGDFLCCRNGHDYH